MKRSLVLVLVALSAACTKPSSEPIAPANPSAVPAPASAAVTPVDSSTPKTPPSPGVALSPKSDLVFEPIDNAREVKTPAGLVTLADDPVPVGGKMLLLENKVVYPPTCDAKSAPICREVRALHEQGEGVWLKAKVTAPDGVTLVLQLAAGGNACNGSGFLFLRLRADHAAEYTGYVPYCGGPDPAFAATADKIRIHIPAHPKNRGAGKMPEEIYEYDVKASAVVKTK